MIWSNRLWGLRFRKIRDPRLRRQGAALGVGGEQRFNFPAQIRIAFAGMIEKGSAFVRCPLERATDDFLNPGPLLLYFHAAPFSFPEPATPWLRSSLASPWRLKFPAPRRSLRWP